MLKTIAKGTMIVCKKLNDILQKILLLSEMHIICVLYREDIFKK